jgi:hypothetical protein
MKLRTSAKINIPTDNSHLLGNSLLISDSPLVFAHSIKEDSANNSPRKRVETIFGYLSDSEEYNSRNASENNSPRKRVFDYFKNRVPEKNITVRTNDTDTDIDIIEEYSSVLIEEYSSKGNKCYILERIIPSTVVALGTGLAMMPIFNNLVKHSEEFGIDIHSNRVLFNMSTANTFIVAFFSSFSSMYHFIAKHQTQIDSAVSQTENKVKDTAIILSKILASCSALLPLGLLWGVELQNQKIVDSSGFDKFIAWATFTTIPLIADNVVESVQTVNNIHDNPTDIELDTMGSKLVVYGLAGLSIAGRVIAYTEVVKTLAAATGISQNAALGIGIAGGLLGSGGITAFEYNAIKSLFAKIDEPFTFKNTFKKALIGTFAALEGAWFSLPIVALGLNATTEWNPLLKGALFTPLFVSHSIFEATKIYNNIMMGYDSIYEEISTIMGDYCDCTVLDI